MPHDRTPAADPEQLAAALRAVAAHEGTSTAVALESAAVALDQIAARPPTQSVAFAASFIVKTADSAVTAAGLDEGPTPRSVVSGRELARASSTHPLAGMFDQAWRDDIAAACAAAADRYNARLPAPAPDRRASADNPPPEGPPRR